MVLPNGTSAHADQVQEALAAEEGLVDAPSVGLAVDEEAGVAITADAARLARGTTRVVCAVL
jgi:hypothetical protein